MISLASYCYGSVLGFSRRRLGFFVCCFGNFFNAYCQEKLLIGAVGLVVGGGLRY
jgi:hypothetical protein